MARVPNCGEVASLLQPFADGGLPAGERASVEEHLADCPACAREVARIRENAAYLLEAWAPYRMPADFESSFLFRLPKKGARRRGPAVPAAPAAPRTVMMGAPGRSGPSPVRWLVGLLVVGAIGVGVWAFLSEGKPVTRHGQREPVREPVVPKDREKDNPAMPRTGRDGGRVPAGGTGAGSGTGGETPPGGVLRTAADLAAAIRAVGSGGYGPVVSRGWALLSGSPEEAAALRGLVEDEKDPRARAAMVLCVGADGSEENRASLRAHLLDEAPEVRLAAVLGLARALSYDNPAKRAVPAGPPLNMAVELGAMEETPGRADLAGRLSSEGDDAVKRVLVQVLAPSAAGDEGIRQQLLQGVKGAFGDPLREISLRALQGIQDPAMVPALGEALAQPGLPRELFGTVLDTMLTADKAAAADALAAVLPSADRPEARKQIVEALGRAGGEAAERALRQAAENDAEPSVRLSAVQGLQRFPTQASLEVLERVAQNDADQMVRVDAERAAAVLRRTLEKPAEGDPGDGGAPEGVK